MFEDDDDDDDDDDDEDGQDDGDVVAHQGRRTAARILSLLGT